MLWSHHFRRPTTLGAHYFRRDTFYAKPKSSKTASKTAFAWGSKGVSVCSWGGGANFAWPQGPTLSKSGPVCHYLQWSLRYETAPSADTKRSLGLISGYGESWCGLCESKVDSCNFFYYFGKWICITKIHHFRLQWTLFPKKKLSIHLDIYNVHNPRCFETNTLLPRYLPSIYVIIDDY